MSFQSSKFKFIERGFEETLCLIPGWATDYRIYSHLDLNYNYLLAREFYFVDFIDRLLKELDRLSIAKISLFGWSLGGLLAAEFAAKNATRINELILVGIRKKFNPQAIKEIGLKLKKNKRACLYKFYQDCFSRSDLEGLNWFKKSLLKRYLDEMKVSDLLSGLEYLASTQIQPETLISLKKIRIFQGSEDKIAPQGEVIQLKSYIPYARFICLWGLGHIPFLNPQFKDRFY